MSLKGLAALIACVTLLVAAAGAQRNEISGTLGRVFVSSQAVKGGDFSDPNIHFGNGLTIGGNYSRFLKRYGVFGISGEVAGRLLPRYGSEPQPEPDPGRLSVVLHHSRRASELLFRRDAYALGQFRRRLRPLPYVEQTEFLWVQPWKNQHQHRRSTVRVRCRRVALAEMGPADGSPRFLFRRSRSECHHDSQPATQHLRRRRIHPAFLVKSNFASCLHFGSTTFPRHREGFSPCR